MFKTRGREQSCTEEAESKNISFHSLLFLIWAGRDKMKMNLNVSQIVGYSSKLVRFGLHMQPGDETGKIVILVSHVVIDSIG